MRLLLISSLLCLVSVQPWLVAGFLDPVQIMRYHWEKPIRDEISSKGLSAEDPVLVTEPPIQLSGHGSYDPFDHIKKLNDEDEASIRRITAVPALTSNMIFFDEITESWGGFEVDNSKKIFQHDNPGQYQRILDDQILCEVPGSHAV